MNRDLCITCIIYYVHRCVEMTDFKKIQQVSVFQQNNSILTAASSFTSNFKLKKTN